MCVCVRVCVCVPHGCIRVHKRASAILMSVFKDGFKIAGAGRQPHFTLLAHQVTERIGGLFFVCVFGSDVGEGD